MGKVLFFLLLALAGLVAADLALGKAEGRARSTSSRVRRLAPPETRDAALVSVVRLDDLSRGASHLYAKIEGLWRCVSYRNAVVNDGAMESLLKKVFNGEGLVRGDEPSRVPQCGLDGPSMLRVSLHGPRGLESAGQDRLVSIDVGSASSQPAGGYVRATGGREIVSVDVNLREELAPDDAGPLPPLVDRNVVPAVWPGFRKGIKSIVVEPEGAPSFELEGRRREITPEDMRSGKSPWEWFLKQAGGEQLCEQPLAMSYVSFLMRAPCMDVMEAKGQAGVDLKPRGRVTLVPNEGDALPLSIGSAAVGLGDPVLNPFSKSVYFVSTQVASLLVPRAEQLLAAGGPNPWEPYLKR
jgi:hypothetical protein